jgi:hypothetical protein
MPPADRFKPYAPDVHAVVRLTAVFQETVVLALHLGLARLGHVALGGAKLKANASKHKAMS